MTKIPYIVLKFSLLAKTPASYLRKTKKKKKLSTRKLWETVEQPKVTAAVKNPTQICRRPHQNQTQAHHRNTRTLTLTPPPPPISPFSNPNPYQDPNPNPNEYEAISL